MPQVAAVQVCNGLEGVHLQARAPPGEVVLQLSGTEEGEVQHRDVAQQQVQARSQPMYFRCMPPFSFIPESSGCDAVDIASLPDLPPGFPLISMILEQYRGVFEKTSPST